MKVLVACEFSGRVRDAFIREGHDAVSCDLLESERPGPHIQGDVLQVLEDGWDLMIAHPPCTHLAVSGARWFKDKLVEQEEALDFVRQLMSAPIPRICVENPISIIATRIRKPNQHIQPWQYDVDNPFMKTTCLWLQNLPKLKPTCRPRYYYSSLEHYMGPSADRWKDRSRTYEGIAAAMASQWGSL